MFTGIVSAIGRVRRVGRDEQGVSLTIGAPYRGLRKGESIAVDGACLTVERRGAGWFSVHLVPTTLARTRFGDVQRGDRVNLERALRVGDRLGGHLVQGHVDGVGRVVRVAEQGEDRVLDLEVPAEVAAVSLPLGSITVSGVSLTVNARPAPSLVQISLIPFTLQHSTLGYLRVGDPVHLEGDVIGKYLAALLANRHASAPARTAT